MIRVLKNFLKYSLYYLVKMISKFKTLPAMISEYNNPYYTVESNVGALHFYTPNWLCLYRAKTFYTKEPDTISWISKMDKNSILFDIGANVGLYTNFAGKNGMQVFAFEPEAQNFAIINRNIHLNQINEKASAYNFAISSKTAVDKLYIKQMTVGGALNNFGSNLDLNKREFKESFRQGVISVSIDDLIDKFGFPVPNYLKIDVDGLEAEIIQGASQILKNTSLKSILIELNTSLDCDQQVIKIIENNGFIVVSKLQPPECKDSEFKDVFNFIFERRGASSSGNL